MRMARDLSFAAIVVAAAASAQNVDGPKQPPRMTYAELRALSVPVTAADITDHPYKVIGRIETNVRKATIVSGPVSTQKAYRELWERGRKMGADAVINADVGDSRMIATSFGARMAKGDAVRFVEPSR